MTVDEFVVWAWTVGGLIGIAFNLWKIHDARHDLIIARQIPGLEYVAEDIARARIRQAQIGIIVKAIIVFIGVVVMVRQHAGLRPDAWFEDWAVRWFGDVFRWGMLALVYGLDFASLIEWVDKRRALRRARARAQ